MDGMTDAFQLPPDNMLSEQIVLADHHLALGLMHMDGAGLRVCIWDGEAMRHMSRAAAVRFARELAEGDHAEAWGPVIEAILLLADRIVAILGRAAARRAQKFEDMPVEGHA